MRFEPGLKTARHKCFVEYLDGKKIAPINVEISPSGRCNANCPWCFYRQEDSRIKGLDGEIFDENLMKSLIEDFETFGVRSISWTGGGEPTTHPSFGSFVAWAYESRIRQGLFTNAIGRLNFDPLKFDWIRVSKTEQDWNVNNLLYLRSCNTLGLCLNYRGPEDDETLKRTLEIAEKVNATYVQVRPALKIAGNKKIIEIPKIKHPLMEITDYKFAGVSEERNYQLCEGFHFIPFIWQDGDVDVCGYHRKNPKYNLGNLNQAKFSEIMAKAPNFIKVGEDCQTCCKLNAINSTIANMRQLEDLDFP